MASLTLGCRPPMLGSSEHYNEFVFPRLRTVFRRKSCKTLIEDFGIAIEDLTISGKALRS
eukprot:jgi/Botrbrau1/6299/Bobra.0339s0010.1